MVDISDEEKKFLSDLEELQEALDRPIIRPEPGPIKPEPVEPKPANWLAILRDKLKR